MQVKNTWSIKQSLQEGSGEPTIQQCVCESHFFNLKCMSSVCTKNFMFLLKGKKCAENSVKIPRHKNCVHKKFLFLLKTKKCAGKKYVKSVKGTLE